MKKNILLKLSICSFIFTSCSTWNTLWLPETASTPALRTTASNEKNCPKEWVAVNNRKDSQIRSNPAHYWCWISKNMPIELQNLVKFQGPVTGDPHYFNFGDVHRKKGNPEGDLTLVDVDDSGNGSYIYDLIRYAIFVRAYNKDTSKSSLHDLIKNYIYGLSKNINKMPPTPKYIDKAIHISRKQLLNRHKKWVKDNTKSNKLIYAKLNLQPFEGLNTAQKNTSLKLSKLIQERTNKNVLDIGFTVYDSGSSNGLTRYWFLIQHPKTGNQYIKECKTLSTPAVELAGLKQTSHEDRIENVLQPYSTFRSDVKKDSFVLTVDQNSFWCRYREFQAMKRAPVKAMKKGSNELAELSEYFAFWLGAKISYLPNAKDYLKALEQTEVDDEFDKLLNNYEKVFKDLNQSGLELSKLLESNEDNYIDNADDSDDTPHSPLRIYPDAADDDE